MTEVMKFDQTAARRLERVYLTPDVMFQRCETLKYLELYENERVLDIGSGPGLLAYDMAVAVGSGGRVCGVDISADMLEMARRRCSDMSWAVFDQAEATELPFADSQFDAAASTQVYEYVPDVPLALRELFRVLRPGGRAVIVDTDYQSLVIHTEHHERMQRIMAAWDEHFVHGSLPQTLSALLREAGFTIRQRATIPMFNPEYHANTYSHGMVRLIANFVAGRPGVTPEEAAAWVAEFDDLGARGRYFFSLNRYLFVAGKP